MNSSLLELANLPPDQEEVSNKSPDEMSLMDLANLDPNETPEPTRFRKIQYGAAKSRFLLPMIYNVVSAAWKDGDFDQNLIDQQEEYLKNLYKDYPEFAGGIYDEDPSVIFGDIAVSFMDPVSLYPPARGAAVALNTGKAGVRNLTAAAIGVEAAGYSTFRQLSETGDFNAGESAVAGLTGAAVGNIVMPWIASKMGVKARMQEKANGVYELMATGNKVAQYSPSTAMIAERRNLLVSRYGFTQKEVDSFEEIVTNNQPLRELWLKVESEDNSFNGLLRYFDKRIKDETNRISVDANGNKIPKKKRDTTQLHTIRTLRREKIQEYMEKQAGLQSDMVVQIMEELAKNQTLTDRMIIMLNDHVTRPIFYGGIGGASGLLLGDTADIEDPDSLAIMLGWTGVVLGALHRKTMASKYIPTDASKRFLQLGYHGMMNTAARYINVSTSMTQATRLNSMGNETTLFSRLLFNQHGRYDTGKRLGEMSVTMPSGAKVSLGGMKIKAPAGNQSVESRSDQNTMLWHRAIDDALTNPVTREKLSPEQQLEVVRRLRGYGKSTDPEVLRASEEVRDMYTYFIKYATDAGFTFPQEIPNYFTRVYNPNEIGKDFDGFTRAMDQVMALMYPKMDMGARHQKALGIAQDIQAYQLEPIVTLRGLKKAVSDGNMKAKPGDLSSHHTIDRAIRNIELKTPTQVHIERQRILHTKDPVINAKIEEILEPYLVNDPTSVVYNTLENSVRSIEVSRTFGKGMEGVKELLLAVRRKYDGSRQGKMMHPEEEREMEAIINGVNSFFGRYGENTLGPVANRILTTLATASNVVLLAPNVTISALGDLLQPIQNSKNWSAMIKNFPVLGSTSLRGKWDYKSANMRFSERTAIQQELAAQHGLTNSSDPYVQKMMQFNTWLFSLSGLTSVTSLSRRYAYNTGMEDAFISAQKAISSPKSIVTGQVPGKRALSHLQYLETLGVTSEEAKILSQHSTFEDAFRNPKARTVLERAGYKAAERDAKIANVGNRLLFVQSRDPTIRLLGQYTSWLQAKSAQTNELIERIEDGDTKVFVAMLAMLPVYAAQQDFRYFFSYGEWPPDQGMGMQMAKGAEMSSAGSWPVSAALGMRYNLIGTHEINPSAMYPIPLTATFGKFLQAIPDAADGELFKAAAHLNPGIRSAYQGYLGDVLGTRREYRHEPQTLESDLRTDSSSLYISERDLREGMRNGR